MSKKKKSRRKQKEPYVAAKINTGGYDKDIKFKGSLKELIDICEKKGLI